MSPAGRGLPSTQSWQDAAVAIEALGIGPDDDILAVAGAGDTALAYATAGPRSVVCVGDPSLLELKLAAVRELPVASVRSFVGLGHFGRRVWFYHHLRAGLSPATRAFWDAREDVIRAGLLDQGETERAFARFRAALPRLVGNGAVEAMLVCRTIEEQRAVYAERWDTRRWRAARAVLARGGGPLAGWVRTLEPRLTELPVAHNYFLQWALTGRFLDIEHAHAWVSAAGHAAIRGAAPRIRTVAGALEDVATAGAFSAFDLGDVTPSETLLARVCQAARPGARVVGWGPPPGVEGVIRLGERDRAGASPWILRLP